MAGVIRSAGRSWSWSATGSIHEVLRAPAGVARLGGPGVGRDYHDVPPLKGIYSGGGSTALDLVVEITRLA